MISLEPQRLQKHEQHAVFWIPAGAGTTESVAFRAKSKSCFGLDPQLLPTQYLLAGCDRAEFQIVSVQHFAVDRNRLETNGRIDGFRIEFHEGA